MDLFQMGCGSCIAVMCPPVSILNICFSEPVQTTSLMRCEKAESRMAISIGGDDQYTHTFTSQPVDGAVDPGGAGGLDDFLKLRVLVVDDHHFFDEAVVGHGVEPPGRNFVLIVNFSDRV